MEKRSRIIVYSKCLGLHVVALDRAHQHLSWLHVISNVVEKSKSNAKKTDHELLVNSHQLLSNIVAELIDSSCLNLRNYALQSLLYIRRNNLPTLEAELESDLEALNYPKCVLGNVQSFIYYWIDTTRWLISYFELHLLTSESRVGILLFTYLEILTFQKFTKWIFTLF